MLPHPHFYWKVKALSFYKLAILELPTYWFLSDFAEQEGKKYEYILVLVGRFKSAPYPLRNTSLLCSPILIHHADVSPGLLNVIFRAQ